MNKLVEKLEAHRLLTEAELEALITGRDGALADRLRASADAVRRQVYGDAMFIRGLIEVSNICKNDCLYCGIRRSNTACDRYRLTAEQILACCAHGYALGFRTFVLQGGEDGAFTDDVLVPLIAQIKENHPDCAVTLSLGERSRESYQRLYDAGADRYLLRHETADSDHYARLHPTELTLEHRLQCLRDLKAIGYQVGCGFMVGSPYQTPQTLAKDLHFIQEFRPDMVGIGPFIPHKDTPFRDCPAGDVALTCYLLSIVRLIHPAVLLPATTALGTLHPKGREWGMQCGANVVMPNLSPEDVRDKYMLYDNKLHTGAESADKLAALKAQVAAAGYTVVCDRGDVKK